MTIMSLEVRQVLRMYLNIILEISRKMEKGDKKKISIEENQNNIQTH